MPRLKPYAPALLVLVPCLLFALFALSMAATRILATVGGEEINALYFQKALSRAVRTGGPNPGSAGGKRAFMEFLIDTKRLALEARAAGIDRDPEVRAEVEVLIDHLYAAKLVEQRIPKAYPVSEKEARRYYEEHLDEFTRPEQVLVRQIVVKEKEQAAQILSRLEGEADFSRLARLHSIDPSAKAGGLVGWLRAGRLPEKAHQEALRLRSGEISAPVRTDQGFHLLKVENRQEARVRPFSAVKAAASAKARLAGRKRLLEGLKEKLQKKYKVEINQQAMADYLDD